MVNGNNLTKLILMKKSFVFCSLVALALMGCHEELGIDSYDNPEVVTVGKESKVFTAIIEDEFGGATKTSLDAERNVLWKQGDQVGIFAASTVNEQYQVTDESDGKTAATLNKVGGSGVVAGAAIDNNVAFYPYASTASIAKSGDSYIISDIELPAIQNYAEDSFGNGAFPMASVTSTTTDMNLKFKNVLGGLKLQLKGTATIASIKVTGNNNEILCGDAEVTVAFGSTPAINLTETSANTVTLDCGAGVALNSETVTPFIIALPPMTMTGGFTVIVTDTEGKQMEISTSKSQAISRSSLLKMPTVTYEGVASTVPYLPNGALNGLFSVGQNKKVLFSKGNLQYSGNNIWGFAEQQYEIIGDADSNIYLNYSAGKVDLFCWSGNSHSNYGLSTNSNSSNYDGLFLDWGAKIDRNDTWRTLSEEEWRYLLGTSEERNGKYKNWVNVNGVNGLVIAPDDFSGTIEDTYNASTWAETENDGLVFLPISGYRYQNYVSGLTSYGYYWSSTTSSRYNASASEVYINQNGCGVSTSGQLRRYACCVRLVSDITAPEAVDLGLSVKWASCNVGARNPFGYGHHYAWGEVAGYKEEDVTNSQNYEHRGLYTKLSYYGDTYKYCTGNYPYYTMTKYTASDNLTVLEPDDDSANIHWGDGWRMPTSEEMEELLDPSNCSWTWCGPSNSLPGAAGNPEFNGVPGYKVQSLKPGFTDKYIFLPASGYRASSTSGGENVIENFFSMGYYWTSTLRADNDYGAMCLQVSSNDKTVSSWDRVMGCTIRPVRD